MVINWLFPGWRNFSTMTGDHQKSESHRQYIPLNICPIIEINIMKYNILIFLFQGGKGDIKCIDKIKLFDGNLISNFCFKTNRNSK